MKWNFKHRYKQRNILAAIILLVVLAIFVANNKFYILDACESKIAELNISDKGSESTPATQEEIKHFPEYKNSWISPYLHAVLKCKMESHSVFYFLRN